MVDGRVFPIYQMRTMFLIAHEIPKTGGFPFRKKYNVCTDITGE